MEEVKKQDYTEISSMLGDIEDVNKSFVQYIIEKSLIYFLIITLVALFAFGIGISAFSVLEMYICIIIIYSAFIHQKIRHIFMKQVADKLGYEYSSIGSLYTMKGKLFDIGHSGNVQDIISGKYLNFPLKIFNYYFTVGYGKSSRTYGYTVFEIQFNTDLPEIVLLTKDFLSFLNIDILPLTMGKKKLSLEGDFDKYFQLYVPKDLEIEVLEIFTPDVMAELIDKFRGFNIEICEDKMYVYYEKIVSNKKQILLTYELVGQLSNKLNEVLCDVGQDIKEEGLMSRGLP